MGKKGIDRLIKRYMLEIFIAIFFIVISYTGIMNNPLHESSAIAKGNIEGSYEIQYEYGRNTEDVFAHENILDRGNLSIRNPNKETKKIKIDLLIYGDLSKLDNLQISFGNDFLDMSKLEVEGEHHRLNLATISLGGYEKYIGTLFLYGNPSYGSTFAYDFDIKESFYS